MKGNMNLVKDLQGVTQYMRIAINLYFCGNLRYSVLRWGLGCVIQHLRCSRTRKTLSLSSGEPPKRGVSFKQPSITHESEKEETDADADALERLLPKDRLATSLSIGKQPSLDRRHFPYTIS